MIVGVFIKGYKTYSSLTFIPFLKRVDHRLSVIIGQNGAGKSSVLEALDVFFNGASWNKNINSKPGEGFVCPVFLEEKRSLSRNKAAPYVSDYFWKYKVPETAGAANFYAWERFCEFRDDVLAHVDKNNFHLIVAGCDENGDVSYTSTHKKIKNSFKPKGVSYSDHDKLIDSLRGKYSYIYLPIHNSPAGLVDLKARELQGIMDKNLLGEINAILKSKERGGSSIEKINGRLDRFLDEINYGLRSINGDYTYKSYQGGRLTESDISEVILRKYFASRPLQKEGKPIESLSSGEQRMAIIDVAYSFLSQSQNTNKELVLAIDEPESSLNAVNCMNQFKRVFSIANSFGKQCLISTHWYGLLMSPEYATLNHISRDDEDRPLVKTFDLSCIQEDRRRFPDDLQMKSYFDLVSSILAIVKGDSKGWVICEGGSDRNYLNKVLGGGDLNFLPVGGCGNVVKIYEYLKVAVEDKNEQGLIKGKVLCVIDSDLKRIPVGKVNGNAKKTLSILRFQVANSGVSLVDAGGEGDYSKTEIEDALGARSFYVAMKDSVDALADDDVRDVFYNGFEFDEDQGDGFAKVNYGLPFLRLKDLAYQKRGECLKAFLDKGDVKNRMSMTYEHSDSCPEWAEKVFEFFNDR